LVIDEFMHNSSFFQNYTNIIYLKPEEAMMSSSVELLKKINADNIGEALTLADIMSFSPVQFRELAGDQLTLGEIDTLYALAQQARKDNIILESRILSRANPQLASLAHLGVSPQQNERGYTDTFPSRANNFVAPGSVSSMFSPAAYLTELYREAKLLHPETSQYNLNKRRPDLGKLLLSQVNMDTEVSTLSLSNELLMNIITTHQSWSPDKVMEVLSTYRYSSDTPYHGPYSIIRQSILQRDPQLAALAHSPYFSAQLPPQLLMALEMDVPPELLAILTEDIIDENVDELFEKNFGSLSVDYLSSVSNLAYYYDLSTEEMATLVEIVQLKNNKYNKHTLMNYRADARGHLSTRKITREWSDNYADELNYLSLFPLSDNDFYVAANYKKDAGQVSIKLLDPGTWLANISGPTKKNIEYTSSEFTLSDDVLSAKFKMHSYRYQENSNSAIQASSFAYFSVESISNTRFILLLNKLVRFYKASSVTLSEMERFALDIDVATFSDTLLYLTAYAKYLTQQYALPLEAALVLADADIGTQSTPALPSQFDLLFNTPPLNGQTFALGGDAIVLNPARLVLADSFRRAVLKRALRVDDAGLWLMHQIGNRTVNDSVANTLTNLSGLYRISLLAQAHALTVNELNTLLLLSPYHDIPLYGMDEITFKTLTQYLFFVTEWLAQQKWSVNQLFVMVTDTYATVWTASLDDLQQTLLNGLREQPDLKGDALVTAMAPFIASSLHLNTSNLAESCLRWANQIQPAGQTTDTFWGLIQKTSPTDAERNNIIAFAQTLAQLTLIVNNTAVSEQELALLVGNPPLLASGVTTLGLSVDSLQQLTLFHRWINGAGDYANDALTALNEGKLDATLLANTLKTDVMVVTQAIAHGMGEGAVLAHWSDVFAVIQWLDVADVLGITPDGIATLMTLTYDVKTPYASWVTQGDMMSGALGEQDSKVVHDTLDERLSAALSSYFRREISLLTLNSHDELYSYLLIDNQVSAQVKTTRLAEAIASLQLYVYRTLNGQETGADTVVSTRQFFVDWDTYNARYSTWAGVSQLVYYPENYVDPTMRVGQTAMMDKMLQQISQSTLNSDVVERGLFDYLTAFDEIANLDVISGYHDNADINQGLSYFVSCSQTEPKKFYWRSVDHSKSVQGDFSANAWSEWSGVTCAIMPWDMIIRPVLLNSRLFISWIERTERVSSDGTNTSFVTTLKLSRMNYDGGWSSPFSYDVTTIIHGISEKTNELGMFCSEYQDDGSLIVYFYKKEKQYAESGPATAMGLYIYSDMSRYDMVLSNPSEKDRLSNIKKKTHFTLDTLSEKRINNTFTDGFLVELILSSEQNNNDYDFICDIPNATTIASVNGDAYLNINPLIDISYKNLSLTGGESNIISILKKEESQLYIYEYEIPTPGTSKERNGVVITVENNQIIVNICTDVWAPPHYLNLHVEGMATIDFNKPPVETQFRDGVRYTSHRIPSSILGVDKVTNIFRIEGVDGGTIKLSFSNMSVKRVFAPFNPEEVTFSVVTKDVPSYKITAKDGCVRFPRYSKTDIMRYAFTEIALNVTNDFFGKESVVIPCTFTAVNTLGVRAKTAMSIILTRVNVNPGNYISLHNTLDKAQYMQQSVYRTRLNTLFATQLISRASAGLGAIYSMDTQLLPEPKLGEGTYVTLELGPYDSAIHGSSREFTINYVNVYRDSDKFPLKSGQLSDTDNTIVTLFVPRIAESYGTIDNLYLQAHYQKGGTGYIRLVRGNATDPNGWRLDVGYNDGTFAGLQSVYGLNQLSEQMDFDGANALYFWELFYYTPVMVFARLLQENQYDEALTWLKYIWNPAGYTVHGVKQNYYWNCRPLEEDTSWNAAPLDSVDPDAVAQNDPMHYKVATFMSMLDLLIARGDAAYRQLDRDTLNEAKMWYMQALSLLGDEPYVPLSGEWESPSLSSAASQTTKSAYQQALLTLRKTGLPSTARTANSLTALFLPEVNGKLQGYWQLLAQRLYNLRHNLSIDGQPLSLPLFAIPVSPVALQSAAVASSQGGKELPQAIMPLYRFPVILNNTRTLVGQLMQFGSTLQGIIERQDGEAMAELLQTQARDLSVTAIAQQNQVIAEVEGDKKTLQASRQGAQNRYTTYASLYDENVNVGERQAMDLYLSSSTISATGDALRTTAAAMDLVPNIYGLAVGGSRFGAMFDAMAIGTSIASQATRISGDRISYNEHYRRRHQEWAIQRNNAEDELKQIDAQLVSLSIRHEAAMLQKTYLETQQAQTQAQLEFLQRRFSNKALYNWLRGCLSAIYYQFYDLTVSRCLMSQEAYRWETNKPEASFIKPGAWNSTYAGLMAGENLMLNLTQMEGAYLKQEERQKEVTRTVSLAKVYAGLKEGGEFVLSDEVKVLLGKGAGQVGTDVNGIKLKDDTLASSVKLADLGIMADYPDELGNVRRIKQISVTLPMLMGPYQDVQAVLSYGGSVVMPRGCDSLAVSHGMNDSGQFLLDFNDARYLPFEGIPVNDTGTLTLSFPNATGKQENLLLSLSDIILHIRYTIRH
jgi:hypothetical protein